MKHRENLAPLLRPFVLAPFLSAPLLAAAGGGLDWADIDGDGRVDVLFAHGDRVSLLRNAGDGSFEDVTAAWGLDELDGVRQASFMDLEADGVPELLLVGGVARVLADGGGFYVDVSERAGVTGLLGVEEGLLHDYDADGATDLVLSAVDGFHLLRNQGDGTLALVDLELAPEGLDAGPDTSWANGAGLGAPTGTRTVAADGIPTLTGSPGAGAGQAGGPGSTPIPSVVGTGTDTAPMAAFCADAVMDLAGGGCVSVSSTPMLGTLYPLSQTFYIASNGFVGLNNSAPVRRLHMQDFQSVFRMTTTGGTFGSVIELENLAPSPSLLGALNFRNSSGIAGQFVYTSDERFEFHGGAGLLAVLTPEGHFGLGSDAPNGPLRVLSEDASVQAARIESVNGSTDNLVLYHNGDGKALNASSNSGIAARVSGATGLEASGSTFAVDATTNSGTALRAVNTSPEAGLGAFIESYTNGAALLVSSKGEIPNAAFFGGQVQVGSFGAFGIPAPSVEMDIGSNGGGYLSVNDNLFTPIVEMGQESSAGGYVRCRNSAGVETVLLDQDATSAGYIALAKADGTKTIFMDADSGGNGRITTDVLQINGGADLVESFETREGEVEPGTVMVIDPDSAGELTISREPYDAKVAGIVSGAGGVRAGLSLGQDVLNGDTQVALTGRVYVKASCENGAIRPGDRLASSATPGHAMRATDEGRAPGAVLGKAMSRLEEGTGLVLVLVNPQ